MTSLGLNVVKVTNTLAYYDGALIKMVKSFIVHACMALLGLNLVTVTNTLAYYDGVLIKVVKRFITGPWGLYYKPFYCRNLRISVKS